MKKLLLLLATISLMFAYDEGKSGQGLGYRSNTLFNENFTVKDYHYSKDAQGTSKKIQRSYQDAPPQIPHTIDGILPITIDNNACIQCHDKAVAKAMGSTPMPKTHYQSFRKNRKNLKGMSKERFNCSQCHVPQSNLKPLVVNHFKPDYRKASDKTTSHLDKNVMKGVKK